MRTNDRRSCVRPEVPAIDALRVLTELRDALDRRLGKHGSGAYAGPHEILGVIDEEYDELRDAVRSNVDADTAAELMDIAVGCVFGIASLRTLGRIP